MVRRPAFADRASHRGPRALFPRREGHFSTLRLDLRACGPFHKAVYDATRAIGWGAVATYGEIARGVGSPGAARAVEHRRQAR
ncbi:MGMT family protein [Methylocystis sp. SC2]|uniref:MGMT family protein n=1 Tax=Methylocystis sp. (strain SC2) TaxID=187303 RepID=UPI00130DB363